MRHLFRYLLAPALTLWAASAVAEFHTFQIEEVFSNADGTVQYVVMHESEGMSEENFWMGNEFTSTHLGTTQTYIFRNNLPGVMCGYYGCGGGGTANKRVLIATQGFADLHVITPDFVVPNGFIPIGGGTLNYSDVDFVTYGPLPTDGRTALNRNNVMIPNVATNFAGSTASVSGAVLNFSGLWYKAPAESESGWGINFAHQGDVIFASWFTYDMTGKGWWLVMTANNSSGNTFTGTLLEVTGPPFDAVPFPPQGSPGGIAGSAVGTGTLAFTDANNGTFTYMVNGTSQVKAITRQAFGPLPTCTFSASNNLAAASNYQGLWYKAPAESESGWGVNFSHQGDTIFATWFTFDHDRTPMWLIVTAKKSAPGIYTGALFRPTSGPPFNSFSFPPIGSPGGAMFRQVGDATITFSDGNNATFAYSVDGAPQTKAITRQVFRPPGAICQ